MLREQLQLIVRDYDHGLITKAFALYALAVLLTHAAEDGLMPSDVSFMLGIPAQYLGEASVH